MDVYTFVENLKCTKMYPLKSIKKEEIDFYLRSFEVILIKINTRDLLKNKQRNIIYFFFIIELSSIEK